MEYPDNQQVVAAIARTNLYAFLKSVRGGGSWEALHPRAARRGDVLSVGEGDAG